MDGRSWLGLGPRARTTQTAFAPNPVLISTQSDVGAVTTPSAERSLQRSLTQIHIPQPAQKTARLSRISSYIGLSNAAKAQATSAVTLPHPEQIMERSDSMSSRTMSYHEAPHDPTTGFWRSSPNTDNDFIYKESDQTWHNPNLTQMMDTVSSTIMSNGVSQPIPRHLNSFVVGMIEEFRIRLSKQSNLEAKLEELKSTQKRESQELAAIADEWKHREASFKSEVRRLEQIIAEHAGVSSVVFARAGSVYNRNDAKDFQAKLNRLSKSEDDGMGLHRGQQVIMEGEMRNFAALPMTQDTDREIVLDHNSDAFMSKLWRPDAQLAKKRNANLLERLSAAQQFFDENGRPRLSSDHSSRQTSPQKLDSFTSSSGVASSASSSLITQGVLAARARDHVTPHTTPPRPGPIKPSPGANPVQAPTIVNGLAPVQELIRANGGLPEHAIDNDDSSYGPSFVPPPQVRRFSFDAYDDKLAIHDTTSAANEDNVVQDDPNRIDKSTTIKKAPFQLSDNSQDNHNEPIIFKGHDSNETPSSQSSKSSCCSSTLMAMAHNCIDHAGQSAGPDCPRNSPMQKVQTGADPFPDEATKYKYRIERTVLNAHIREVAYLTSQELRAVMDDRSCRQSVASLVPAKIVHNPDAPRVKGPRLLLHCPPGFEDQATAGLLPLQQAPAKKHASEKATATKAAADKEEVIQGKYTNHRIDLGRGG
ncbi:hypothetical protein N0V93_006594 [Gnomoniopsis smithogilvyi]|uniref:Uncharacterized protein n=1 Tax=Gnomoniopsis smithogilvyi TaxID=1191159 RepID=A0A9W8YPZ7_9PEZI|nr:hypothetical protein N0V93_006594 [Gnomoniopsis smithogilvyi]